MASPRDPDNGFASMQRATQWRLRSRTLALPRLPILMGIVNVTPDSFSDAGQFADHQAAIDRAKQLVDDGAALIDVGGESTRPYSEPVGVDEELRRTIPVVQAIAPTLGVPISIDTSKARVAREAISAGAEIINDVTGLTGDPEMIEVALSSGTGVSAMHMQGTPQTMQDDPRYDDVVADVWQYLRKRRDALNEAGIEPARIALDPGIGFGKTHEHNLALLRNCDRYHELGCPLLVGHSRKGFIAHVLADKETDRTHGTVGVALALATRGVQIIRVHDVLPVAQALALFEAAGGLDKT